MPLISRAALTNVRDFSRDHSRDNVLLEYQAAISRVDAETPGDHFGILPILIGDRVGDVLTGFSDFNPSLYSDSVMTSGTPAPNCCAIS